MKLIFPLFAILVVAAFAIASPRPTTAATCTMVMGFSQTKEWYLAGFESIIPNGQFQGLNDSGTEIQDMADPNSTIWSYWASGTVYSKCTTNWQTPDRVVLNISGDFNSSPTSWKSDILAAVATIRSKLSPDPQILLQPVVGGPNHADCGTRASYNHPYIDQGIALAVAQDPSLVAGFSPEVASCSQYRDDKGHLSSVGASYVAQQVGAYFNGLSATSTPVPPTSTPVPPTATPTPPPVPVLTLCERVATYSDGSQARTTLPLGDC